MNKDREKRNVFRSGLMEAHLGVLTILHQFIFDRPIRSTLFIGEAGANAELMTRFGLTDKRTQVAAAAPALPPERTSGRGRSADRTR